jgi:hypothetical protein
MTSRRLKPPTVAAIMLAVLALLVTGCGGGGGRTVSSHPPRAGQSCAGFNPSTGPATLSANLDCDLHSRRFVEAGARCGFATYRPTAGHLVCRADGKLVRLTVSGQPPRVGQSCAGFNPLVDLATLPANLDCDRHTNRYVAEGQRCDSETFDSAAGHLLCYGVGKLVRPQSIPSTRPCKVGQTRTLPNGQIEKCVPAPPVSPPFH